MALSGNLYMTADLYFHRGVGHTVNLAFRNDFFQRLKGSASPSLHTHLARYDVSEMMPWLRLATRLNPQDVETYLVTAFWLAKESGRPDLAIELLTEAQVENPFDYRIQLEKGRIHLKQKNYHAAADALDAAIAFWPSGFPDNRDTRFDRASALLYRAMIDELSGETDSAVARLSEIVQLFPERQEIRLRIDALRSGRQPSHLAAGVITDSLAFEDSERTTCHREDGHEQEGTAGHRHETGEQAGDGEPHSD